MLVALPQGGEEAGVVDRDRGLVGEDLEELGVLLLEDPRLEGVVHVDGADALAPDQERHRDDRAQVAEDHRLVAPEALVVDRVGRQERPLVADALLYEGSGTGELLVVDGPAGIAAGDPHPQDALLDEHHVAAGCAHGVDDLVHRPPQHLIEVEAGGEVGGDLVEEPVAAQAGFDAGHQEPHESNSAEWPFQDRRRVKSGA